MFRILFSFVTVGVVQQCKAVVGGDWALCMWKCVKVAGREQKWFNFQKGGGLHDSKGIWQNLSL